MYIYIYIYIYIMAVALFIVQFNCFDIVSSFKLYMYI